MKLHFCEQGSDEWKQLRAAHFTASTLGDWLIEEPKLSLTIAEMAELLALRGINFPAKAKWAEMAALLPPDDHRDNLKFTATRNKAWKRAINIRLGKHSEDEEPEFDNYWTRKGKEREPLARDAYATHFGVAVNQVGFVSHDSEEFGCSPDGLICGDIHLSPAELEMVPVERFENGLEIKCHKASKHGEFLDDGGFREEHAMQVHASMAATGIREWHLWAWHPELPPIREVFRWDATTDKVLAALLRLADDYEAAFLRMKSRWLEWQATQPLTPTPA